MRKLHAALLLSFVILMFTTPVFAQGGDAASNHANWVVISAGFAMAIASSICGLAQGRAISAACEGLARNPGAAPAIRFALLARSRSDRVSCDLHAGRYFRESIVEALQARSMTAPAVTACLACQSPLRKCLSICYGFRSKAEIGISRSASRLSKRPIMDSLAARIVLSASGLRMKPAFRLSFVTRSTALT